MTTSDNTAAAAASAATDLSTGSVETESSTTCPKCSRDVPTANFVLHEAACGRDRFAQQRPSQQTQLEESSESQANLPPRERGQQTLDMWLSTAGSSSGRSARSSTSRRGRNSENNNIDSSVEAANSSDDSDSGSGSNSESARARSNNGASGATETASNSNIGEDAGSAAFVGNIRPRQTQPTNSRARASGAEHLQVGANQWQCARCTLVNEDSRSSCNVCLAPRNGNNSAVTNNSSAASPPITPPDATMADPLLQSEENGWVNVTYNPQFQRGRNGIMRVQQNEGRLFNIQFQNPMVHGGILGTVARIFNGLLNGAIVGSILAGPEGMIAGGLAGAAGGALVDRARNREERNELRETREVANMLVNDDGGIEAGTVRVHRGNGHITALARDGNGRNRVIRVRYDGPRVAASETTATAPRRQYPAATADLRRNNQELRRRVTNVRDELERSLLQILVQMSYSRDFGPGPGNNIILEPEESFDELTRRFELGNGNRGARQAVIDSYPTEIIGGDGSDSDSDNDSNEESSDGSEEESESSEDDEEDVESSHGTVDTDDTSEFGTCCICLEDFKRGESVKHLSCPHHFHGDCIDKWLKLVASCPICKEEVGMYQPSRGENSNSRGVAATRAAEGAGEIAN